MIYHAEIRLSYDRERIFRRLHIQPDTPVYEYSLSVFPDLVTLVHQNLHMINCFTLQENTLVLGIPEVDDSEKIVVCLSSCGEEIVSAINTCLEKGNHLEAYILNDLVNEILFNASEQMNRQAVLEARKAGSFLTRRFSPGEGELDLFYQAELLKFFREDPALKHIHLTDSCMIYPEKSMLYLFGADPKNPEISVEHDCSKCPNKDCFFRSVNSAGHCR